MSEDVTLDAFADDATASDADTHAETVSGTETATDRRVTDDDGDGDGVTANTIPVTSSWRANATCSSCGESAARRWQDGDERVCAECASWTTTGRGACDQ